MRTTNHDSLSDSIHQWHQWQQTVTSGSRPWHVWQQTVARAAAAEEQSLGLKSVKSMGTVTSQSGNIQGGSCSYVAPKPRSQPVLGGADYGGWSRNWSKEVDWGVFPSCLGMGARRSLMFAIGECFQSRLKPLRRRVRSKEVPAGTIQQVGGFVKASEAVLSLGRWRGLLRCERPQAITSLKKMSGFEVLHGVGVFSEVCKTPVVTERSEDLFPVDMDMRNCNGHTPNSCFSVGRQPAFKIEE